jgi:DNA-binding NtrC family response regulator
LSNILVADDTAAMCDFLKEFLEKEGHSVVTASNGKQAFNKFMTTNPDVIITDMKMPKMTGLELIEAVKKENEDVIVIVMTAFGTVESAVAAMKAGAYDYILKPFSIDQIKAVMKKVEERLGLVNENRRLKGELQKKFSFENIIGTSSRMEEVYGMMRKLLNNRTNVLILGETGTGKELVARALHYSGNRRDKPFIRVNCSALPENLLESELFGHERGAFTGAENTRKGRFELADGGTIFLDEIGDISHNIQVKLLRVIQFKEIERIGSAETIPVDVRIIAATNVDLEEAVESGKFRKDLYYRLNVLPITVPPLRDRMTDVPLLAEYFLKRISKEMNKKIKGFTKEALELILGYSWPGNVRELENLIERACVLTEKDMLDVDVFPSYLNEKDIQIPLTVPSVGACKLNDVIEKIERDMIKEALTITGGQQTQAAQILGINRGSLIYKMKKYGLTENKGDDS